LSTEVRRVIKSQYGAALEMLRQTVLECPDELWEDGGPNRFWHVAYHALFYVHLYAQPTESDFAPWARHRQAHQFLGPVPWPPFDRPEIGEPYTREEIVEYLDLCRAEVVARVDAADLEAASGFEWLPFGKLELLLYSLRHLQHHVGELSGRLLTETGREVDWVGMRGGG